LRRNTLPRKESAEGEGQDHGRIHLQVKPERTRNPCDTIVSNLLAKFDPLLRPTDFSAQLVFKTHLFCQTINVTSKRVTLRVPPPRNKVRTLEKVELFLLRQRLPTETDNEPVLFKFR